MLAQMLMVQMMLEQLKLSEDVEMLRIIENGYKIKMIKVDEIFVSVDTKEKFI
jgi:CMP-2-keto-3-deoxyoctulosonic acid synthetase